MKLAETKCESKRYKKMKQEQIVVENVREVNFPEKKFRAGAVSATIWLNKTVKDGEVIEYRTISVERSYTDKNDKWQSTNSLRVNDLPKARVVVEKAYEHLVLVEQEIPQRA
jgi:hypothetical protein